MITLIPGPNQSNVIGIISKDPQRAKWHDVLNFYQCVGLLVFRKGLLHPWVSNSLSPQLKDWRFGMR